MVDFEPFLGVANRVTALYAFQPGIDVGTLRGFPNLTELGLQPGGARTVDLDLDAVPSLRTLSTCRPTRFVGGAESGLRDLHVERAGFDALEVLARLPRPERLKIYGAFPEHAPASLRVLEIAAASAPARVSPLPSLKELHLTKITGLADLSLFAESERLRKNSSTKTCPHSGPTPRSTTASSDRSSSATCSYARK